MKKLVITGANSGLGYETAKHFANDYHIIMCNRNLKTSNEAIKKIKEEVPNAKIDLIEMDLADRDSIIKAANEIKILVNEIDFLINNAGIMMPEYTITKYGNELQFETNHLGHFLFTAQIFPLIKESEHSRIITVSSLAHAMKQADIHFDNLSFEGNYHKMTAYCQAKLANALFGVELGRRLANKNSQIKSIIVHPGVSLTNLFKDLPMYTVSVIKVLAPLANLFGITKQEDGAKHLIYAVECQSLQSMDYVGPNSKRGWNGMPGVVTLSNQALDPQLANKLWEYTENELNIKFIMK
ncbi:MAG: SDR family NAD(P)-dependent oxidoreductase [Mycoplasmatales bacterium]